MLHVAVVGDHASGKTTFLGLLYAALVKSGSDKTDDLRFHAALDSIEEITGLFQELMSGGFPDSATKEGIHEFSFQLALNRVRREGFPLFGSRKRNNGAPATVRIILPGSLDEQHQGFLQESATGKGRWRDALDADAVIVLADSTKLAPKGEDPGPGPMEAYDGQVEAFFTSILRWRARGGRDLLHPIFVFSKFDAVPPEVVRAANVEPAPPDVSKPGPRAVYAKALLEPNLPRTLALARDSARGKLRFARPRYFFSSVRTDAKGPGGSERIRLRRLDGGGWEPDYSGNEFLALLECIGEIAAQTED